MRTCQGIKTILPSVCRCSRSAKATRTSSSLYVAAIGISICPDATRSAICDKTAVVDASALPSAFVPSSWAFSREMMVSIRSFAIPRSTASWTYCGPKGHRCLHLIGLQYVQLVVDLGIVKDRIETIISREKAQELGTKAEGSADASTTAVLSQMADLVASGQIEIPIAATYKLDDVRVAFADLEQRHTLGKIVLIP